jgi:uncharacterized protein (TIGR02246 family)
MRIAIGVLAIAVSTAPVSGQARPADEVAVRARVTALETAINQRDAAGYAALFAPDGDSIVLDAAPLQGRAAIQASVAQAWATTPNRRASITPTAVRFITADVAVVNTLARFTVNGTTTEDRGTWILHRQDGVWLIAALRVLPALRS